VRLILIAALLVSTSANAFNVYHNNVGDPLRWNKSSIGYRVTSRVTKRQRRQIAACFQAWSDIARIEFYETDFLPDIEISIERGRSPLPIDILGSSSVSYSGARITNASIALNLRNRRTRKMFCAIVTHEIGHCIGIAHSNDPKALMAAEPVAKCIQQDDIDAALFLYKDW
jgi:hypothetical protein